MEGGGVLQIATRMRRWHEAVVEVVVGPSPPAIDRRPSFACAVNCQKAGGSGPLGGGQNLAMRTRSRTPAFDPRRCSCHVVEDDGGTVEQLRAPSGPPRRGTRPALATVESSGSWWTVPATHEFGNAPSVSYFRRSWAKEQHA